MNKRSAMLMAAGLVIALAVGAAATSLSLGTSSSAEGGPATEPIVRTVRDTVTVHEKAADPNAGPTVVTLRGSSDDAADDVEDAREDATDDLEHDDDDGAYEDDHEGGEGHDD